MLSTLIHLGIATSFAFFIYKSYLFANVSGFLVTVVWSYYAQSKYVFYHAIQKKSSAKFFFIQIISFGVALMLADYNKELNIYLKTLLVCLIFPFLTFLTHKIWTFKNKTIL